LCDAPTTRLQLRAHSELQRTDHFAFLQPNTRVSYESAFLRVQKLSVTLECLLDCDIASKAFVIHKDTDECRTVKGQTCGNVNTKLFTREEISEIRSEIRQVPDFTGVKLSLNLTICSASIVSFN
jgi:hypothetical protein